MKSARTVSKQGFGVGCRAEILAYTQSLQIFQTADVQKGGKHYGRYVCGL